jgi:hypothetical protein
LLTDCEFITEVRGNNFCCFSVDPPRQTA